jgi:AraC-like DNA-binding protein
MTIYEQIQVAIEFIEANLFSKLTYGKAAAAAIMSARSFYNYFWMITGFTYKEYVKKRRLAEAMKILVSSEDRVLDIALSVGYESHESFTRAFRKEFGISPIVFKKRRRTLKGLEKIQLIKEMYMGVIVKELPELRVACFDGFAPESETRAGEKMKVWMKENGLAEKPHRTFGHNIDREGKLSYDPVNVGYRFMVTVDQMDVSGIPDAKYDGIRPGKFVVTGIEGNIGAGDGKWIGEGWQKMNEMVCEKGYKVKQPARWFEEELKPSQPGNLHLDLYLEIER